MARHGDLDQIMSECVDSFIDFSVYFKSKGQDEAFETNLEAFLDAMATYAKKNQLGFFGRRAMISVVRKLVREKARSDGLKLDDASMLGVLIGEALRRKLKGKW